MTVSLKHTFQSAKTDSADATLIQPSNWNEEHELTAAAGKVLGRDTSGNGAVQELPISVTPAGNVTIPNNLAVTGTLGVTGTSTLTNLSVTGTTTLTNALAVTSGGTGVQTLPANNVLIGNGTSAVASVAPGAAGNVLTSNGTTWASTTAVASSTLNAIATGSLANGSTVVINADGTVSVVSGRSGGFGTATVFESAASDYSASTYDANAQKVVIAYQDDGNSSFGTAVVGTVTGTSISFGTPVVFQSASLVSVNCAIVYDANTQKVVIIFREGSNGYGTAIVGTVSGTSISFGTKVAYNASSSNGFSAAYDSVGFKVVIAYRDAGNSSFRTAIVGTVSGTSISFGAPVVYLSATADTASTVYDSAQQKIVIAWTNFSSTEVRAVVGTVSGTSISFGTSVLVDGTLNSNVLSATYASAQAKVVVFYKGSGAGYAVVGTVSGTSITFGSRANFISSAIGDDLTSTYDLSTQKVVVAFESSGNQIAVGTISGTSISFAASIVFQASGTARFSSTYDAVQQTVVIAYRRAIDNFGLGIGYQVPIATNLTSENFIGFSNAAYTNGQNATIQLVGAVDDAQSGLTPGQSYFVQVNGTLGLTPASPSVFAGTAVAANKIIVKG